MRPKTPLLPRGAASNPSTRPTASSGRPGGESELVMNDHGKSEQVMNDERESEKVMKDDLEQVMNYDGIK